MKKIPALKRDIGGFLTKNSKSIIIAGTIGGVFVGGLQQVNAGHTNAYSTDISPLATFYPTDAEADNNDGNWVSKDFTLITSSTCGHVSGIVNGHLSSVPAVSNTSQKYTVSKKHANHGNHSSGGWCP